MPQFHVSAWASVVLVMSLGLGGSWLLLPSLLSMSGRERHPQAQAAPGTSSISDGPVPA